MGIDVRIETERGECVSELGDPRNLVNWLFSMEILDSTVCLRFIDPYGDTVFNGLQIPVLRNELSMLASRLTEPNLQEIKRAYLGRAKTWPSAALQESRKAMEALSLGELRHHVEKLLHLVSDASAKTHHYVRFIGD